MGLEREQATYEANKQRLLAHEGKWVVIQGDTVDSIWDTYGDALQGGYRRFRLTPFMVKQVFAVEPVHYFGLDILRSADGPYRNLR